MSRSFKHMPVCTDRLGKLTKQQANKRLRKMLKNINYEIGNFNNYRMAIESYDIRDYKLYKSKQQMIKDYNRDLAMGYTVTAKDNYIKDWKKYYINK